MQKIKKGSCPEFPFFGARYPDAQCIDGILWDLDSCDERGLISIGDNPPCPFCNTKPFIDYQLGDFENKYSLLKMILAIKKKYS
jgi:hypothetical protein